MLNEYFVKKLANAYLNKLYHENEKEQGRGTEWNEQQEIESAHEFNSISSVLRDLFGREIEYNTRISAIELAKQEFAKGNLYIEAKPLTSL